MSSSQSSSLPPGSTPQHVAIIMDGNGRWAQSRHLPRIEGHRAGAKTVRMVVEEARRAGVRYLTLYAFSSENWNRPASEVSALMKLFEKYLESELGTLLKNGVRLRAIGDLERLPQFVQEILHRRQEETAQMDGMDLVLAVSYGGRDELVRAARKLTRKVLAGEILPEEIQSSTFAGCLDAPDIPDPDLLIRTSSEHRISNFLLWQLAYTEICVIPEFWPELTRERFQECLQDYSNRVRRFGLTDQQLEEQAPHQGLNNDK